MYNYEWRLNMNLQIIYLTIQSRWHLSITKVRMSTDLSYTQNGGMYILKLSITYFHLEIKRGES